MSVMAARGFVTREADPSHGRIILLKLTDEGAAMRECEAVLPARRACSATSPPTRPRTCSARSNVSRNLRG